MTGLYPGGVAGLPAHDGRLSSGHDRGVDTDASSLQVELEDAGGTRWWKGLLATVSSQYGNAYRRFVGRVDGQARYASSTFSVPRTWGEIPPQEQWAPEMTDALTELRRELEKDGWVEVGRGDQPWALRYQRATSGASSG